MTRMPPFASPLMLGFDAMEKTLERIAKGNDGYPPYNIERLRPNGDAGMLVSTIEGFRDYQLNKAWDWEHQALTRARFCAGDAELW